MKQQTNYKDCLTNELLMKRFPSQFDLVRYALGIATSRIQKGQDNPTHAQSSGIQNVAFNVLEDIAEGEEGFDDQQEENNDEVEIDEELIATIEKKSRKSKE